MGAQHATRAARRWQAAASAMADTHEPAAKKAKTTDEVRAGPQSNERMNKYEIK